MLADRSPREPENPAIQPVLGCPNVRSTVACLVLIAVLGIGLAAVPSGVASAQESISSEDIAVRDGLIAAQENLLNSYRCLFGADVDVVPGGCPNPDVVLPSAAPESPTQQDVDVRDRLILSQEALLNVYRCRFNVDTEVVFGGCENGEPAGTVTIRLYHCIPGDVIYSWEEGFPGELGDPALWTPVDARWVFPEGELERLAELANEHLTPFFLRESGGRAVVKFEAGAEVPGKFPQPIATLADIATGRNTPGTTSENCRNQVLQANGGWTYRSSEPNILKAHWVTLVRDSILFPGHPGLAKSARGPGGWVEGPAFVVYQDGDHYQGDPFPLAVVAHEVAHMLWDMQHVNEANCEYPNSVLGVGGILSECPGVRPETDLAELNIDCRNRQRADWLC